MGRCPPPLLHHHHLPDRRPRVGSEERLERLLRRLTALEERQSQRAVAWPRPCPAPRPRPRPAPPRETSSLSRRTARMASRHFSRPSVHCDDGTGTAQRQLVHRSVSAPPPDKRTRPRSSKDKNCSLPAANPRAGRLAWLGHRSDTRESGQRRGPRFNWLAHTSSSLFVAWSRHRPSSSPLLCRPSSRAAFDRALNANYLRDGVAPVGQGRHPHRIEVPERRGDHRYLRTERARPPQFYVVEKQVNPFNFEMANVQLGRPQPQPRRRREVRLGPTARTSASG